MDHAPFHVPYLENHDTFVINDATYPAAWRTLHTLRASSIRSDVTLYMSHLQHVDMSSHDTYTLGAPAVAVDAAATAPVHPRLIHPEFLRLDCLYAFGFSHYAWYESEETVLQLLLQPGMERCCACHVGIKMPSERTHVSMHSMYFCIPCLDVCHMYGRMKVWMYVR